VSAIIQSIAEALNVNLVGDLSARSVGRVVKEGGVAAQLQLVDEIKLTKSIGDGTSHRRSQYESRHGMNDVPTYNKPGKTTKENHFYRLGTAPKHTSKAQMQGWQDLVDEM
ncbi:hypothetical protein B0H10DRAFT_1664103, partial [Mycena sp. CBHHK59/15]